MRELSLKTLGEDSKYILSTSRRYISNFGERHTFLAGSPCVFISDMFIVKCFCCGRTAKIGRQNVSKI